jgi:hypothetical protein
MLPAVYPIQTMVESRKATATATVHGMNAKHNSQRSLLEIDILWEASILADEMGWFRIAVVCTDACC